MSVPDNLITSRNTATAYTYPTSDERSSFETRSCTATAIYISSFNGRTRNRNVCVIAGARNEILVIIEKQAIFRDEFLMLSYENFGSL